MTDITRRTLLKTFAGAAVCYGLPAAGQTSEPAVAMLHCTDLFRPHVDPDDHWDLACVYALAYSGAVDLKGIVIDSPPDDKRDGDVLGVSQMNHITSLAIPVAVGGPRDRDSLDSPAVSFILKTLRQSRRPVVINIIGSCRNIALAVKMDRDLFAEKCCAVYLNAGTGSPDPALAAKLEYNVSLDPGSYAAMFELPCPLYWMPCFEEMGKPPTGRAFGTFYRFRQDEILPAISDNMQKFFAYMYSRTQESNWLRYLQGARDEKLLAEQGLSNRNMWCTGGFLHAAGKTATTAGRIIDLKRGGGENPVFTFDPVSISCDEAGVTRWAIDKKVENRYVFHVHDTENYASAMTTAMKSLLTTLP